MIRPEVIRTRLHNLRTEMHVTVDALEKNSLEKKKAETRKIDVNT